MQQQSEQTGNLQKALAEAQGEFTTVPKKKTAKVRSQRTGGEFTYHYADLADVLSMALPVLSRHGLAVSQPHIEVNGRLRVCTKLMHASGEWMMSDGIPMSEVADPQDFGKESTYYRRYDACSLLGIAPDEDTDVQEIAMPQPKAAAKKPAKQPDPEPEASAVRNSPSLGAALDSYDQDRQEVLAQIMAVGCTVAELAELRNRLFPGHSNSATMSLLQLQEFNVHLRRQKEDEKQTAVRIPDTNAGTFMDDLPPEMGQMFESGQVQKASALPAKPKVIGKTKAHNIHKVLGAAKVHTEDDLREEFLDSLKITHLSDLPEDLYAPVMAWAEGKDG